MTRMINKNPTDACSNTSVGFSRRQPALRVSILRTSRSKDRGLTPSSTTTYALARQGINTEQGPRVHHGAGPVPLVQPDLERGAARGVVDAPGMRGVADRYLAYHPEILPFVSWITVILRYPDGNGKTGF